MIQKYKLLKDLPDLKAGHVFTWNEDTETYVSHSNNQHPDYYWFTENKIKDTEWFEPVIKFVKGKWYLASWPKDSDDYYLRCKNPTETGMNYDIYIRLKDSSVEKNLNYGVSSDNIIKEVPYSEVEPYLKPISKLTFGGKEVSIVKGKYESTTMINCADFSCTLLHLKVLYDSIWELTNWNVENDKFKVKEIDGIELPFETITIGCQTDTIDKLKEIIDTATKLMK